MDDSDKIPSPQQPLEERILFIQENMVSFVKQYNMPIVEVALVISKYIRILLEKLQQIADESGEELPSHLLSPTPFDGDMKPPLIDSFPLERLLDSLDEDRMDILDTLMRTAINAVEAPFSSALALFRDWERLIRSQLSESRSPGHLFSPMKIPEDF
ncbi:MAG: hypothetical protein VXZ65_00885 [Candidatus Thermoplasmatota archaeon]|nr:hypothetical protein [Candidatus Thermoplasmatota archaeon]MEC7197861.1 hypothetical protein [Candidatus Thermoplasmatota archaeon]MEC7430878.1 hypothetical protein [Candidatus Thermoplasmatota archaeon]MEC7639820.1 hypothetical protein [Candidatus Thermoplasmatota archaeon]MEC8351760.1 hypothetical protein [Candidatus Thermoplasmatota archaeon]